MKRFVCLVMVMIFALMVFVARAEIVNQKKIILGETVSDARYQISCIVPNGYSYEAEEIEPSIDGSIQGAFRDENGEEPAIELIIYPCEDYNYPNINRMPYEEYVEFMYLNYDYQGAHISQSVTGRGDIYIIAYDDEYRNEIYVGAILKGHFVKLTVRKNSYDENELDIDDSLPAEEILDSLEINSVV